MSLAFDLFRRTPAEPNAYEAEYAGDPCTMEGALRLKQKIEEYWAARGATVNARPVEAGFVPAMRSARVDVRSDMLSGWPKGYAPSSEEQS